MARRGPPDVPALSCRVRGLTAATNHGDTCGTDTAYAVSRPLEFVAARAQGLAASSAAYRWIRSVIR
jgi:hypothetical protein